MTLSIQQEKDITVFGEGLQKVCVRRLDGESPAITVVFIIPPHLKKTWSIDPFTSSDYYGYIGRAGVAKSAHARVFVIDMGVTSLSSEDVRRHLQDIQPIW